MEFKIDTGVPYAIKAGGRGRGRKPTAFPFTDMQVGDSFLIECDTSVKKTVDSWRRKVLVAKKRFNEAYDGPAWEFRTAIREGGIRVWRTEAASEAT